MSGQRRRYSDTDKATALALLAAHGGNILRCARELRIPRSTLRKWRDGEALSADVAQLCHQKKGELAGAFDALARQCVEGVTQAKLDRAGLVDLVKAAAIAVDKALLLRGRPTAINRNGDDLRELTDEELERRIAEMEAAEAAYRQAGWGGTGPAGGEIGPAR